MNPTRVVARVAGLLGGDAAPGEGVVHVTSAWRSAPDSLRVLRLTPDTPSSRSDRLVLGSVRARADVILTTGAVLRAEPEATPRLHPDRPIEAELARWRRVELARPAPPVLAVLTSGVGLDPGHPSLAWPGGVLVLTGVDAARSVRAVVPSPVRVVGFEAPSARRAVEWLAAEQGARTVAVEAGPTAAGALYRPPVLVDELVLTVLEAGDLPEDAAGGELPAPSRLRALLGRPSPATEVVESGCRWTFRRYRGRPRGDR